MLILLTIVVIIFLQWHQVINILLGTSDSNLIDQYVCMGHSSPIVSNSDKHSCGKVVI